MSDKPLPTEDQLVTMVSVRDGNIYVTSARVLVSKPKAIGLHVDTSLSEPPTFDRAQPLTLLYTRGDRVLRLKAVVREPIDEERLTVQPVGDVKEGDRRDFRRADITAKVFCRPIAAGSAARESQLSRAVDESEYEELEVNLSGSGAQFTTTVGGIEDGGLLDLRIVLPLPTPTAVKVLADVVRATPQEDGRTLVATRFGEISESDQDLVVYTVFSRYFEAEGLSEELGLEV